MRLSAERESYFGNLLQHAQNTARPDSSFQHRDGPAQQSKPSKRTADSDIHNLENFGTHPNLHKQNLRKPTRDGTRQVADQGADQGAGRVRNDSAAQDGLDHIVRFVESFERPERDFWLVFHDEGTSLHSLMYDHVALGAEDPLSGKDHTLRNSQASDRNLHVVRFSAHAMERLHRDWRNHGWSHGVHV